MGLFFTSASSMRIFNNTPPLLPSTGFPLVVGAWVYVTEVAAVKSIIGFYDNATVNNYLEMLINGDAPAVAGRAGGTAVVSAVSSKLDANNWCFMVGRFLSSTQRWINSMSFSPTEVMFGNASGTVARAPTGLDNISVGGQGASTPIQFHQGIIAEVWYMNADFPGLGTTTVLPDNLLYNLAFNGPFAFGLSNNIVEYRSLRQSVDSTTDNQTSGDVYCIAGRQTWADSANSPVTATHPPMGHQFVRPGQVQSILTL